MADSADNTNSASGSNPPAAPDGAREPGTSEGELAVDLDLRDEELFDLDLMDELELDELLVETEDSADRSPPPLPADDYADDTTVPPLGWPPPPIVDDDLSDPGLPDPDPIETDSEAAPEPAGPQWRVFNIPGVELLGLGDKGAVPPSSPARAEKPAAAPSSPSAMDQPRPAEHTAEPAEPSPAGLDSVLPPQGETGALGVSVPGFRPELLAPPATAEPTPTETTPIAVRPDVAAPEPDVAEVAAPEPDVAEVAAPEPDVAEVAAPDREADGAELDAEPVEAAPAGADEGARAASAEDEDDEALAELEEEGVLELVELLGEPEPPSLAEVEQPEASFDARPPTLRLNKPGAALDEPESGADSGDETQLGLPRHALALHTPPGSDAILEATSSPEPKPSSSAEIPPPPVFKPSVTPASPHPERKDPRSTLLGALEHARDTGSFRVPDAGGSPAAATPTAPEVPGPRADVDEASLPELEPLEVVVPDFDVDPLASAEPAHDLGLDTAEPLGLRAEPQGFNLPPEAADYEDLPEVEPLGHVRIIAGGAGPETPEQTHAPHPSPGDGHDEELLPEVEPMSPLAEQMQALEALSGTYAAIRVGSETLSRLATSHFEDLFSQRPGPGGLGRPEQEAAGVDVGQVPDVRLNARTLELGNGSPGGARVIAPSITLAEGLVGELATWPDRPLVLLGESGSGKSHALNSLAAALAAPRLGRTDRNNVFSEVVAVLADDGRLPIPIRFELDAIATQPVRNGQEMLAALVAQRELPAELAEFRGRAVLLVDHLDVAMELGLPGLDPTLLFRSVLEIRPKWTVVGACNSRWESTLRARAMAGGPVTAVEILGLDQALCRQLVMSWTGVARPAPDDPRRVANLLPAEVAANPRLVQMLLAQWPWKWDELEQIVRQGRASGLAQVILEGACERARVRADSQAPRQDLQVLADTLGGLPSRALLLEDLNQLMAEGYLRDDVETLESTGIIQLLLARGDRPVGAVAFTHPLFQEVLLAEYVERELVQLGLRAELASLFTQLQPAEQLTPFSQSQVRRLIEVAHLTIGRLSVHLVPDLLENLGTWLWNELNRGDFSPNPHFPRLVGICWILAATLNRFGRTHADAFTQLRQQCHGTLDDLLSFSGEDALRQAVARL